ncbi:MAG: T9SS type A sorting domain-containing protein [Bacteroidetes bacterium]|nr:T9SS type A sorting domain-containing protein [Bacteroidota bacterium]
MESSLSAPTDYNWTLSPLNGNYVYEHGDNGVNVNCDILFSSTGNYQLVVQAGNTCSAPNFGPSYVRGIYVYTSYYMMISPNPTSGEASLSIESGSPEEATLKSASTESTFDETAEWDLEVYDNVQNLKLKKTKLKGKSTKIQTHGWKDGVYMVRVKYKDEILTGKLVVKK